MVPPATKTPTPRFHRWPACAAPCARAGPGYFDDALVDARAGVRCSTSRAKALAAPLLVSEPGAPRPAPEGCRDPGARSLRCLAAGPCRSVQWPSRSAALTLPCSRWRARPERHRLDPRDTTAGAASECPHQPCRRGARTAIPTDRGGGHAPRNPLSSALCGSRRPARQAPRRSFPPP